MSGGTSVAQVYNSEQIDLLSTHFERRNEATKAWGKALSMFSLLPGLRGFWPMAGSDETGATYDLSGQGRKLTYNGNPYYGLTGLAPYIVMDGAGDYLSRADEAGLYIAGTEAHIAAALRGLTLGGWFYPDAQASYGLITKWGAAGTYEYSLNTSGANAALSVSTDGTATAAKTTTGTYTAGAWHWIVGRFDPSTEIAVWIDTVKETNVAGIPASIFDSNSPFEIGRLAGGFNLAGRASLCFLCGAALPDTVIKALYHHSRALFGA